MNVRIASGVVARVYRIAHPLHGASNSRPPQKNVGPARAFSAVAGVTTVRLPYEDANSAVATPLHCRLTDGWIDVVTRGAGDRRGRVRFEVFGFFWGTFDVREAVTVRNLTSNGALIEAGELFAVESIQSICVSIDGQPAVSNVRVRHLRADPRSAQKRYLVGVEFLSASSAFQEAVDRLVAYRSSTTELT